MKAHNNVIISYHFISLLYHIIYFDYLIPWGSNLLAPMHCLNSVAMCSIFVFPYNSNSNQLYRIVEQINDKWIVAVNIDDPLQKRARWGESGGESGGFN